MELPLIGVRPDPTLPWEDCNWYPVPQINAGKSEISMVGTPGLKRFADLGTNSEVRGGIEVDEFAYVVADNGFYLLNSAGVETLIDGSTILTSSGIVQMESNGLQIMFIDGLHGYIYTLSTGVLARITDTDFLGASTLTYQDGYFIISVPNTRQFFISDLYDGLTWSSIDYALKEGWPDDIAAVMSDHRELWLLGDRSTEVWKDTGASSFPFQRLDGAFLEDGIGAPLSVAKTDESMIWMNSQRLFVKVAGGYTPSIVSSDALSLEIARYSRVDDAVGFAYRMRGRSFYQVTFPTADRTFALDVSAGVWHRRMSGNFGRHRANCFFRAFSKNLVGDYQNGKIYEIDPFTYDEDGEEIRRILTLPEVESPSGVDPVAHNRLTLYMKYGVGLDSGVQGSDPLITLQWSNDSERTWRGNRTASIGKIGEYEIVAAWRRLGGAVRRSYRVTISDPVECIIHKAFLE
ncbi:MAG: hypothetical protein ABFD97_18300 [Syntrophobacter sp.]